MESITPRSKLEQVRQQNQQMYHELILSLDKSTITRIQSDFKGQISLSKFIQIMKKHTSWWNQTFTQRDQVLEQFFQNMFYYATYNSSHSINYQKFTKYIIRKMTSLKGARSYNWQVPYIAPLSQLEGFDNIHKALYLPFLKAICFFQESSNIIYFFDPIKCQTILKPLIVGKKKKQKKTQLYVKEEPTTTTILLNMILIEMEGNEILLTSTNDRRIRGWVLGPCAFQTAYYPDNKYQPIVQKFSSQVYAMCWDPINEIVYCGFKNGSISLWRIALNSVKLIPNQHNSMIMCMVSLPRLYLLATGGIDGKVILWNMANQEKKWVYKQHTRGVLALVYNELCCQLFSAGFDHQICVWNPYTSQLVHKMQIHKQPIISLQFTNNSLISLDCTGNIKVSDIKKFDTISSYNSSLQQPAGIINIPHQNKLSIYGKNILILDYQANHNPDLTDNSCCICSFYHSKNQIVTISNNQLKVWSVYTGSQIKVISVPMDMITSYCQFEDGVVLGDEKGVVLFARFDDEPEFKNLPKHPTDVNKIKQLKSDKEDTKRLLIGSTQLHLITYVNNQFQKTNSVKLSNQQIICLQYHQLTRSILVGTNTGHILIYTQKFLLRQQMGLCGCLINSMSFITDQLLCVIFDSSLWMIEIAQNIMEGKVYKSFSNDSQLTALQIFQNYLFLAKQKGVFQCYQFLNNDLKLKYEIKGHHEDIVHFQCIKNQEIILTTSNDKKTKIWKISNGEYIDQLRQDVQRIINNNKLKNKGKEDLEKNKWLKKLQKCNSKFDLSSKSQAKQKISWNFHPKDPSQDVRKSRRHTQIKQSLQLLKQSEKIQVPKRVNTLGFVKSQSLKERSFSEVLNKNSRNSSLKILAGKRNIDDQTLIKIQTQAKKTLKNQLHRLQKYRSRSIRPKLYVQQKENINGESVKNGSRIKNIFQIKNGSIASKIFSRSFFPNQNTKPIGQKFPKLL